MTAWLAFNFKEGLAESYIAPCILLQGVQIKERRTLSLIKHTPIGAFLFVGVLLLVIMMVNRGRSIMMIMVMAIIMIVMLGSRVIVLMIPLFLVVRLEVHL